MIREAITYTFCTRERKLRFVDTHAGWSPDAHIASWGWCRTVRVTSSASPWPVSRCTHLSHKPCREQFVTVADRCSWILVQKIIFMLCQYLPFVFVFRTRNARTDENTATFRKNGGRNKTETWNKEDRQVILHYRQHSYLLVLRTEKIMQHVSKKIRSSSGHFIT